MGKGKCKNAPKNYHMALRGSSQEGGDQFQGGVSGGLGGWEKENQQRNHEGGKNLSKKEAHGRVV